MLYDQIKTKVYKSIKKKKRDLIKVYICEKVNTVLFIAFLLVLKCL